MEEALREKDQSNIWNKFKCKKKGSASMILEVNKKKFTKDLENVPVLSDIPMQEYHKDPVQDLLSVLVNLRRRN